MMSLMTASPRVAAFQQAPTSADVDRLTSQFLGLEKKADEAYRFAVASDEARERIRRDLVMRGRGVRSARAERSKRSGQGLRALVALVKRDLRGACASRSDFETFVIRRA